MIEFVVVIPARYASERLPGKPLRLIGGRPMIEHVYRRGIESDAREVIIATDDERIERSARAFGADVCMTDSEHTSGTDRLAEVCEKRQWPDDLLVVNLQGDEPMMPPSLLGQAAALLEDDRADLATLASPLRNADDHRKPDVVKVLVDNDGFALYFSRAAIPFSREPATANMAVSAALHHHGIYAYRVRTLRRLVAATPSKLELCEKLEQLRALSLGMRIKVGIPVERPGPGVDTPSDLARVDQLLA